MEAEVHCPQSIKPINVDTVHKICSGQVVLSLAVAVKELIENSLDAKATNIDIRLKNYGIDLIEVSDNGSGVTEDNFSALTLKYHTSKLSDYSDLLGVSSYGFRGEALSSLCALAKLTVVTRHESSDYATKIEYDYKGNIVNKTPCSRQVGTTMSLSNLFHSLPVRQKEFHKNAKREFNKMCQLLYAYCLVAAGVKISCSNQTGSSRSVVVSTQGSKLYKDNIACVFGSKQLTSILELKPVFTPNIKDNIFKGLLGEVQGIDDSIHIEDVEIDLSEDSNDAENTEANKSQESTSSQKSQGHVNVANPVEFEGFISSCAHGSGRSSTDRQFYYVNSRPCEPQKIIKLINEIYKQYNSNQYPFVFLNVKLDTNLVDVNVTPDKRKVFLTKEKIILEVIKSSVLKLFENIPRTLKVEPSSSILPKSQGEDVKPNITQPRIFNSFLQQFSKSQTRRDNNVPEKSDSNSNNQELKRKSTTMLDFVSSKITKRINDEDLNGSDEDIKDEFQYANETVDKLEEEHEFTNKSQDYEGIKEENPEVNVKNEIMYLEDTDNLPTTQIRNIEDVITLKSHKISCNTKSLTSKGRVSYIEDDDQKPPKRAKIITDKEDFGKLNRKTITLKTSLEHVKSLCNIYNDMDKKKQIPNRVKFKGEINPVFNKKCEEELSKEISKESFKRMSIIGQFNLGFIITKLDDDLFIIDQHATDEIYNFETLQKTTELTSQKLVIPQQLELTGVNEQILMDHLDVFKKNGFTFEINENAMPTKRVKLLTLPMSKNWIFGKEDIEELLFMLRESPSEHCRPSRVRAMFASRACRKSVMIGTALSKTDMKVLVNHMADIEQPWNCPHGRPTIRHLVNLAMVHTQEERTSE